MLLRLNIPPLQEPVSLEEVKSYLRITSEHEDDLLKIFISSSRAAVENITGRALLKQGWGMQITPPYPPSFPLVQTKVGDLALTLPFPPLLEVTAVKAGEQDMSYRAEEGNVILPSQAWGQALSLDFWAGYGETPADLPPDLRMAVLMGTRLLYEGQPLNLPSLAPYKVLKLV